MDVDHRGTRRAVRWIAPDTDSVNLSLVKLAEAASLEDAFLVAHQTGFPAQNFVAAGADGRIGWTLVGPIPDRVGYESRRQQQSARDQQTGAIEKLAHRHDVGFEFAPGAQQRR